MRPPATRRPIIEGRSGADKANLLSPRRGRRARGGLLVGLGMLTAAGCCSADARRLDPRDTADVRPVLKVHFQPGVTPPEALDEILAGDVIAFSDGAASSDGSFMFGVAVGGYAHVLIVIPYGDRGLRTLSADSERGVYIDLLEASLGSRECFVYSFPEDSIHLHRLELFAYRAQLLGRSDYDWSGAVLGLNTNLTPNTLTEVGDEYTCATVVAAALHFSGISLEQAHCPCQFVAPGDIIASKARRNLNRTMELGGGSARSQR